MRCLLILLWNLLLLTIVILFLCFENCMNNVDSFPFSLSSSSERLDHTRFTSLLTCFLAWNIHTVPHPYSYSILTLTSSHSFLPFSTLPYPFLLLLSPFPILPHPHLSLLTLSPYTFTSSLLLTLILPYPFSLLPHPFLLLLYSYSLLLKKFDIDVDINTGQRAGELITVLVVVVRLHVNWSDVDIL